MKKLIITIDGPSGAGKSTVAKILAEKLNYKYIDTGAMFRGVAYAYKQKGKVAKIEDILRDLGLNFEFEKETKVFFEGVELRDELREPEISMLASKLSKNPAVREYLKELQREAGKNGGIVIEGRDTGSVVFPDADLKFFLDANLEERARRRFLELKRKKDDVDFETVKLEIEIRDKEDSQRKIAPLVIPPGAFYLDTTYMTVEQVVDELLRRIRIDYGDS
ncbi:MAG: (d)CMP kinase [Desulfobacterota bacterium]|nr:(d)CMP kinase [Thermodesulfobacteriota bacterium]MDW8001895.1 (d)CMP kinase [Deltaproteobacteria bacterium]